MGGKIARNAVANRILHRYSTKKMKKTVTEEQLNRSESWLPPKKGKQVAALRKPWWKPGKNNSVALK